MWVFFPDAFISIEEHETEPRLMCVMARIRGDIERVFPEADVAETLIGDYRFSTSLPRDRVSQAISLRTSKLRYSNFKAAVTDPDRLQSYIEVWGAMFGEQQRRHGQPAPEEPVHVGPKYVLDDPRFDLNLGEHIAESDPADSSAEVPDQP